MAELKEVSAILDTGKVEAEELQAALQAVLFHQCLYEDWPHAPSYRLLVRHLGNVQPILAAFGYGLRHHPVAHMLVLEPTSPVYGLQMSRLKKDETAVLIVLRLLYAEGISALDENGRVEATTDDIHDRLRTCGEEPPLLPRLLEILRALQRKGLVRVGEHDAIEQLTVVTIMPGVTILVSDVYVEAVIQWLEARALERLDAEGVIHVPPPDRDLASAEGEYANAPPESADAGNDGDLQARRPAPAPDMLSAIAAHREQLGSPPGGAVAAPRVKEDEATIAEEDWAFEDEPAAGEGMAFNDPIATLDKGTDEEGSGDVPA